MVRNIGQVRQASLNLTGALSDPFIVAAHLLVGRGSEVDGEAIACVDLGKFVFHAGEADLESLDFAEPAVKFGLDDSVLEVARGSPPGVVVALGPAVEANIGHKRARENTAFRTRGRTSRPTPCASRSGRGSRPTSSSVGVRYSSLGRVARRRAMNARWASIASMG